MQYMQIILYMTWSVVCALISTSPKLNFYFKQSTAFEVLSENTIPDPVSEQLSIAFPFRYIPKMNMWTSVSFHSLFLKALTLVVLLQTVVFLVFLSWFLFKVDTLKPIIKSWLWGLYFQGSKRSNCCLQLYSKDILQMYQ